MNRAALATPFVLALDQGSRTQKVVPNLEATTMRIPSAPLAGSALVMANVIGFSQTAADPQEQDRRFQGERRKIDACDKSMAFQGTGCGSFIRHCEQALDQTRRDQLKS